MTIHETKEVPPFLSSTECLEIIMTDVRKISHTYSWILRRSYVRFYDSTISPSYYQIRIKGGFREIKIVVSSVSGSPG